MNRLKPVTDKSKFFNPNLHLFRFDTETGREVFWAAISI